MNESKTCRQQLRATADSDRQQTEQQIDKTKQTRQNQTISDAEL
ncbi:hypothetical protein Tco_0714877, partial [Tanacetum coccineum]